MRRKLDEIASLTKAHLAIVGQANGTIGFGLETERNVEIVITGPYESVEQARVRLLVLLDELVSSSFHSIRVVRLPPLTLCDPLDQSGLHSEVCEIDYKLHNIISGRKRCVVQTIQEETATNIYFPTPLSGVIGGKTSSLQAKQNLIFITGEFFGVQRARDMLFQVSLHKVSYYFPSLYSSFNSLTHFSSFPVSCRANASSLEILRFFPENSIGCSRIDWTTSSRS